MIKKIKGFFKLLFFEFKKIVRNPILFAFLLIGPILLQGIICFISQSQEKTLVNFELKNLQEYIIFDTNGTVDDSVNGTLSSIVGDDFEITWQNNLDLNLKNLELEKILIVIHVDTYQSPQQIYIYFNQTNASSSFILKSLESLQSKYAYVTVVDFLSENFAVTVNEEYFGLAKSEDVSKGISIYNYSFFMSISAILSFCIMLGISFSMARDNELGTIKQICYTPMPVWKYLLIKFVLFVILGVWQALTTTLIAKIFGLTINGSFALYMLISLLYVASSVSLSMLFSTTKNQISSVTLSIVMMIVPVLLNLVTIFGTLPIGIKILLYVAPITSFIQISKSFLSFGVLDLNLIFFMLAELIVYFTLTLFIVKRKSSK